MAMQRALIVVFFFSLIFFVQETTAATINTASCSYADVSSAVNAAQSGDIVLVPVGNCTWTSTLTITKGIILKGAGKDNTTIIRQGGTTISYEPDANAISNNEKFKITGFTFDGNNNIPTSTGQIRIESASATPITNIIISENKFKNSAIGGLRIVGAVYGVASSNEFDRIGIVLTEYAFESNSWGVNNFTYGTANNFYFENNYIHFSGSWSSGAMGWISAGQGGRYAIRYNTWDLTNTVGFADMWDMHGNQGTPRGNDGLYGTMGAEAYGNKMINVPNSRWIDHRGGQLLMFYNSLSNIPGYGYSTGIDVDEEYCDSCCGCTPFEMHAQNSYYWANIHDEHLQNAVVDTNWCQDPTTQGGVDRGGPPYYLVTENLDVYNYNASCTSSSCSAGVGCGSDTPTGACTPGVGYWKTSQSCSDVSGMVGANPTMPIAGTFYKCTSPNTWTAYYTPYTYPHPLAQDQPQNILPADRRIDWQPGIPGGIPNYPVGVNVKDHGAVGDGVHDDTAAVQAAIAACPANRSVLIPAGTYRISGTINLNKGIVVRGEGPGKTKIIQYANSTIFAIIGPHTAFMWGQDHPEFGVNVNITAIGPKGSDTATLADASLVSVGDLLWIDQLNDPDLVNQNGVEGPCTWCGLGAGGSRAMAELKLVKAKNGNTIQFDQPLYYNYQLQFQPRIVRITENGNTLKNAGVEDLYVTWAPGVSEGAGFSFLTATFSWVKNVESYYTPYKHVEIAASYRNEIRDSYFHEVPPGFFTGNRGYGVNINTASTANLVENNVFYYLHAPLAIGSGGGAGNVIGYNFFEKTSHSQPNWMIASTGTHGAHTYMNLWEGNVANAAGFDNTWGSGSHQVLLRNVINRQVSAKQMVACAIILPYNYYLSFIGNVLGTLGCPGPVEQIPYLTFENNPVVWLIGMTSHTGYPGDPKVNQTLIRHGNWECPNNTVQWDPSITDHNIPASLYLSSKPAFFGNLPWPAIGPDVNPMNGTIPAKLRFEAIMSGAVPGDVNGDRLVDINDLSFIGAHFGRTNTHTLWNATADVVANNEIDIYDVVFVASRFT